MSPPSSPPAKPPSSPPSTSRPSGDDPQPESLGLLGSRTNRLLALGIILFVLIMVARACG